MDGGTFATGLAIGLVLGGIGGVFTMCLFTVANESRQYLPIWPEVQEQESVRLMVVTDSIKGGNVRLD